MKVHGIPEDILVNLRSCQKEAIKSSTRYLKKPFNEKSCLVSLPTGAGKTGVICVVSNIKKYKRVLVLSHRRAVVDQISKQLKGDFFNKIAPESEYIPKPVHKDISDLTKNGVIVSTFQKLVSLSEEDLKALQKTIDLLIVDEGHAEPSSVWGEVARGFQRHKIIITATPYRNDLFRFDVDPNFGSVFTFKAALSDDVLEEPQFSRVDPANLVDVIAAKLVASPNVKCIVKCNKFADVEHYKNLLQEKFKTLAIHDRYKESSDDNAKENVPSGLGDSDFQVIVHQRKLDEGVDLPSAKLLVLTYPVASGRELVQTVGRVVRKYEDIPAEVVELDTSANNQMWLNYREFDEYLCSKGNVETFLDSLDTALLIKRYLSAFPDISYFDNNFKKKFDLAELNPGDSIQIPLASVCFIEKGDEFNIGAFVDTLYWESTKNGELCQITETKLELFLLVAVTFNNSRYLKDSLFFEPKLELTVVKELGSRIALFDSRSRDFSGKQKDYKTSFGVDVDHMLKLAARATNTKTKEAHARSIGVSDKRPESTSIRGERLDNIAGTQGNSSQALSTLKVENWDYGTDTKHSSYYLGIGSGRVSDQKKRNFSLEQLNDWIDDIQTVLTGSDIPNSPLIASYAKPIKFIPTIDPVAIILDLSGFDSELTLTDFAEITVPLNNSFLYREYSTQAQLIPNSTQFPVVVGFDPDKKCFFLDTGGWGASFEVLDGSKGSSVDDFFDDIDIKVLFEDGTSFVNRTFYRFQLPTGTSFSLNDSIIGQSLISIDNLFQTGLTEKDDKNTLNDSFGTNSVFFQLDRLKAVSDPTAVPSTFGPFYDYISGVDLILCTDMNTEPADFIISSKTKLVFVHVKCGSTTNPQSSAGAICSGLIAPDT